MKLFLITIALSILTQSAFAEVAQDIPVFKKLSDRRSEIVFPVYSLEEKQTVVSQVELVLNDLFVHRFLKIQDFGESANFSPALEKIKQQMSTMTDADFHQSIANIFYSIRDLHTSYEFPVPHACYNTMLPFTLTPAIDNSGQNVIAVSAVLKTEPILALTPEVQKISLGDVLVSFDAVPAREAALEMAKVGMGANEAAWFKRGVSRLASRPGYRYQVPSKNTARLQFKNRLGQVYELELPWLAKADVDCLNPSAEKKSIAKNRGDAFDREQLELQETFRRAQKSRLWALTPTIEPIFSFAIIDNENGTYGVLRLDSFSPSKITVDELILLIRNTVIDKMQNTDGLIFDLRNNGGGQIYLAEGLVQLFTMNIVNPLGFQLLNSPTNQALSNHLSFLSPPYQEVLRRAALTGAAMTEPVPLNSQNKINQLGQFYFKPVAVLTNSACYSSCDVASALFQDSANVTIWTEDGNTGGGGANNVQHSEIISSLKDNDSGPFKKLPGSQGIGFAWRQMVRSGKNSGKLIEDTGVVGDRLIPLSIEDLYSDGRRQIKIISADLAAKNQNFQSLARLQTIDRVDVSVNSPLKIPLMWKETAAIEIFQKNTSVALFSTPKQTTENFEPLQLPENLIPTENKIGRFDVVGYTAGKKVWRKVFNYRAVPEFTAFSQDKTFNLSRSEDRSLITFFNDSPANASGWNLKDGELVVSDGTSYQDNIHTEACFFLDLTNRTSLELALVAKIKTELDYDFFTVFVVDAKGEHKLASLSGPVAGNEFKYDLSEYTGQKIEIRLQFTSDAGVTDQGVQIKELILK